MQHHILSLGAGVQSSTLALMADKGLITYNGEIVKPEFAIFADTQAEPKSVYDWLEYLIEEVSYPVYVVTHGNLTEDAITVRTSKKTGNKYPKTSIPAFVDNDGKKGILRRQCTTDYKVRIIQSSVKKILGVKRDRRTKEFNKTVIQWMGISTDEAIRQRESKLEWIDNFYPLITHDYSRQDCLDWMLKNGYPKPPRSACVFCPYHSDVEWLRLKTEEPAEFQRAVEFEQRYFLAQKEQNVLTGDCYLHAQRVPLDQVVFKTGENEKQFGNECEGICGV